MVLGKTLCSATRVYAQVVRKSSRPKQEPELCCSQFLVRSPKFYHAQQHLASLLRIYLCGERVSSYQSLY